MVEKIGLLVDSASDVPTEIKDQANVEVVPLVVVANGQEYLDRVTIQPQEVYQLIEEGNIPKTASATLGMVSQHIEKLRHRGYRKIIAITISSGLSVTNQGFKQACDDTDGMKVTVIDSKSIGIGSGLIAAYAEDLINANYDYPEIIERVQRSVLKSHVYFYISTLKYLKIGGRIGKVAGMVGSVLNIKPVISCNSDGIYYPIAKARSEKKAISKLLNLAVGAAHTSDHFRIAVAQGNDKKILAQVLNELRNNFPNHQIYTGDVSPALGVHTGPGLIGIAVQTN
ncbi:DegV family protein [Lentilactobacillus hilgardii]|uniref:DegV family protein n=1 Tax=Lentilactobacillus hilgardii TaxID=1588 RepID=UPI00390C9B7D